MTSDPIAEIIEIRSQMRLSWSMQDCFVEACQSLVASRRITIDGYIHQALAEYCGITEVDSGD